jgi:hypothetical protein
MNINNQGTGGLDIGDVISLMDSVKEDLRKELISRIEFESMDKRVKTIEHDLEQLKSDLG